MIKLYFKQAFHLLGENKLLSSISIIGTALAIAMIMVIVILLYVRLLLPLHRKPIVTGCLFSGLPDFKVSPT